MHLLDDYTHAVCFQLGLGKTYDASTMTTFHIDNGDGGIFEYSTASGNDVLEELRGVGTGKGFGKPNGNGYGYLIDSQYFKIQD